MYMWAALMKPYDLLFDHILCNKKEKIVQSGTISLGLSDQNLIFCTRKISRGQINKYSTVKTRSMKNYNVEVFKNELSNIDWELCMDAGHTVDENWNIFKDLYMKVVDKLAL